MNLRSSITTITAILLTISTVAPFTVNAQSMPTVSPHPIFKERLGTTSADRGTAFRQHFASGTPPIAGQRPRFASGTMPLAQRFGARRGASTTMSHMGQRATRQNGIIMRAEERATKEIDRRVSALQAFLTRIENVRMSDTAKTALQTIMQQQITNLTALKSQIASTTSTSTMKDTIHSITSSYRVFALVMPQSAITAAADRITQTVSQMNELAAKIATRLGTDADASSTAALADLKAKVADAESQAKAAVAEVTALTPDNGNQTQFAANRTALKDAHKKLQVAQQDLVAARKDAGSIIRALGAVNPPLPAEATTTSPTS